MPLLFSWEIWTLEINSDFFEDNNDTITTSEHCHASVFFPLLLVLFRLVRHNKCNTICALGLASVVNKHWWLHSSVVVVDTAVIGVELTNFICRSCSSVKTVIWQVTKRLCSLAVSTMFLGFNNLKYFLIPNTLHAILEQL